MLSLTRQLMTSSIKPMRILGFLPTRIQIAANASVCKKKSKNPAFDKIKRLQEKFQKDDGKPVFLKGGTMDQVLYRATWVLCFIGLALNIKLYLYYILK